MNVFAYCAANYSEATRLAAGVDPLPCPPSQAETIDLTRLEGRDLIYLNLHGLPDAGALLGSPQGPPVALRANQLANVDLGGAVVFAQTCYLGETGHPMRQALLDAGASVIIAGPGENLGANNEWMRETGKLAGADLLGLWVRRGLETGLAAHKALALALARVRTELGANRLSRRLRLSRLGDNFGRSLEDALGFTIFERSGGEYA